MILQNLIRSPYQKINHIERDGRTGGQQEEEKDKNTDNHHLSFENAENDDFDSCSISETKGKLDIFV
ncbi:hypothetical protein CS022_00880 [Veronia nyctiphanis]|uniref:Uncharacterized protein n=1 Tax=Veronia nyctiphanis TaxID=1278244 RepID=A0A4Q0Z064_9GAMM|nr:hypothetical protein CS022_00880 [Veronia nyctiphanis]